MTTGRAPMGRVALAVYAAVAGAVAAMVGLAATCGWRRAEARERLVRDRRPSREGVVWIHAASVGEVAVATRLLGPLRARLPRSPFVLTCQTPTGKLAGQAAGFEETRFLPLDTGASVRRFLLQFQPSLFVCVETEIWPRLFVELARSGIPRVMVNARVSKRSFARYRLGKRLFAPGLATMDRVCVRDSKSLERLHALGAPRDRTVLCGDLKLDRSSGRGNASARDPGLLLALSTHEGEEGPVLAAFAAVRRAHPDSRLVLAPRHPERSDDVVALARAHGRVARWSARPTDSSWDVLVLDTTGETGRFVERAIACFVGGSMVDLGGHNLAEPAQAGSACATGMHLDNVEHQADLLRAAGALHVVRNDGELAALWSAWLDVPELAAAEAEKARSAFASAAGALDRTLAEIDEALKMPQPGGAA